MDDHDEERLLSDEASAIKFLSDADKKANRKINVSDAGKIADAYVHAFRIMQDNISRMAQSMNFMTKAWMEIADKSRLKREVGAKEHPIRWMSSRLLQQRRKNDKVAESALSAKKQKIADHISDSEEESDIEEYDTEGEISENSSDAEDSDVDEIMTLNT